jgi:hypothetical protein
MRMIQIKTGPWNGNYRSDHVRIGISRGTPRRMAAGYRIYKKLAPGPWFNSVGVEEYYHRYRTEILGPLDPRTVAEELTEMAAGRIPVLLCFETPTGGSWCHRAMAAEWLAEALGRPVTEFGHEALPQHRHPLMPVALRREIAETDVHDVTPYIGKIATIDGEHHRVLGADPEQPGKAILAAGDRQFSTGIEMLRLLFD